MFTIRDTPAREKAGESYIGFDTAQRIEAVVDRNAAEPMANGVLKVDRVSASVAHPVFVSIRIVGIEDRTATDDRFDHLA